MQDVCHIGMRLTNDIHGALQMESHKWRMTISNESAAWRNLLLKFEDDLAKHFGGDG